MVHTDSNQRQEQEGAQEASQHTDSDGLGHADGADDGDQDIGDDAGDGHDHEDIGNDADGQNDQGGDDDVQSIGHLGTDELLDLSHQQNAQDNGQNAATACTQNSVQGVAALSDPHAHQGRDVVDVGHGGDHTQHAAQDGGSAELLSSTVAGPSGDVGHECGVDHGQELMHDEQPSDFLVGGASLSDQGCDAGADTGSDNAGDQGNEDVADRLQSGLDLALLLTSLHGSLVVLPVGLGGHTGNTGVLLEQISDLLGLAGAQDDMQIVHLDDLQHAFSGLQTLDVSLVVVLQVDTQTGHAVGGAGDVGFTADQLQDFAGEFLVSHLFAPLL